MSSDTAVGLHPGQGRENRRGDASQLACAAAVVAEAERDIRALWRDSVAGNDSDLSDRLADVSHALRRAALVLDRSAHTIG